jgi:hypothetical protein
MRSAHCVLRVTGLLGLAWGVDSEQAGGDAEVDVSERWEEVGRECGFLTGCCMAMGWEGDWS